MPGTGNGNVVGIVKTGLTPVPFGNGLGMVLGNAVGKPGGSLGTPALGMAEPDGMAGVADPLGKGCGWGCPCGGGRTVGVNVAIVSGGVTVGAVGVVVPSVAVGAVGVVGLG